jgi:F420-dependent oxidoreductase-like protein
MNIGVFTEHKTVDELVADIRDIAERGFESAWVPQIFGLDAMTALAVVAREVPDIALGTAVVPTYPRHPSMIAAQARTVNQISGGRFSLGIGLSHQIVIESMFGMSYAKPVRHLIDYLSILMPLAHDEASGYAGETLTGNVAIDIPDSTPLPVLVAALGSQMLRVAGTRTEGTITWMTGQATIASHVAPTISTAAADAGRPDPRIVSALPVCITDDVAAARATAAETFSVYGLLPSYRAMLDREGAAGPADVALVGTEAEVRAGIEAMFEAGVTEFVAVPYQNRNRTLDFIGGLL